MFNRITGTLPCHVNKINRLIMSKSLLSSSLSTTQEENVNINNNILNNNLNNINDNINLTQNKNTSSLSSSSTATNVIMKPIEKIIRDKILQSFNPFYYDVINESYKHNVSKDSESHFKIIIISEQFENMNLIQRHRLVNKLLQNELTYSIHALSIQTKTIKEWEKNSNIQSTPNCLGGHK